MHPLKTIDILLSKFEETGNINFLKLAEETSKLYFLTRLLLRVGSLLKYLRNYLENWDLIKLENLKRPKESIQKILEVYKRSYPKKVEKFLNNMNKLCTELKRLEHQKIKVLSLPQLYWFLIPLIFADPILGIITVALYTVYIAREVRKIKDISFSAWKLYDMTITSFEDFINPAEWYRNKIKIEESLKVHYNGRFPWKSS